MSLTALDPAGNIEAAAVDLNVLPAGDGGEGEAGTGQGGGGAIPGQGAACRLTEGQQGDLAAVRLYPALLAGQGGAVY